jgi:hypothetical protein
MTRQLLQPEFTYENFTGIIQDIIPDNNYIALKNIFPEITVAGNILRNTIANLSRKIVKSGVRNKGDVSYNVDKQALETKKVEMFPYKLNMIFEADEFENFNNLGEKEREIEVARWINFNIQNKKTMIQNTWEYFCWQLILNGGVLDLTDNETGVHYKYDFSCKAAQKVAANTLTTTAKWDDYISGVSDPLSDLQKYRKKLKDIAGSLGNVEAWANSNTWRVFAGNPKVSSNNILSDMLKNAFFNGNYEGLKPEGVQIRVNDDTYEAEKTTDISDYIPDGYIIFKSAGVLGDMQRGTDRILPVIGGGLKTVQGMWSFPIEQQEPASIKVVSGFKGMLNLQRRFNFLILKAY